MSLRTVLHIVLVVSLSPCACACAEERRGGLDDPSFELPKEPDQFGLVFAKWGGWKYEGDCSFAVGEVARTGKHSCLLVGGSGAKIRVAQNHLLAPGRYQITAYLRGLDIGTGTWNMTTEFMFDGKYMQLNKNGTFGWTRLTYVAELAEPKEAGPSFGLMAPGLFWIDDVSLTPVGSDVPLTEQPVIGPEEAPIVAPGDLGDAVVRCTQCSYRNNARWQQCYACGRTLNVTSVAARPARMLITSIEDSNPFSGGQVVQEHATDGSKSLRIDKSYVSQDGSQNWLGFDYLKADLFCAGAQPQNLYVEIRDAGTRDYWTRVNYETIVPPGASTLVIPLRQLYVGEKSRPGRMVMLAEITRLVFNIGDSPHGPLYLDNLRLERDTSAEEAAFEDLHAFDFGLNTSPVMEGFTAVTPSLLYNPGRGFGLKDARIWQSFDVLQPDPLYQDFICLESGGLAVDLPNGSYRVFVNMDNPSGFWGEYQVYGQREILAEGKVVVKDQMDFVRMKNKYFRFWNVEDLPSDNTFDKYQTVYYDEKTFDVDVRDGQLNVEFAGQNWACSVSAIVVFPVAQAAKGAKFLEFTERQRRFHFDNYFKRVLHAPTGDSLKPSAEDERRGCVGFVRDYMEDVYYNDTPRSGESGLPLRGAAFAGELEPLTLAVVPLRDLGDVTATVSDLVGPAGKIAASAVSVGYVSYRINRVTMQGSVYTIGPRLVIPDNRVAMPAGVTRRFWLTVKVPPVAAPGLYRGNLALSAERGASCKWPIEFQVRDGSLDAVDIPAGPWGYSISLPWPDDDPVAGVYQRSMTERSLRKLREYGFTTFSGAPTIHYRGFEQGRPSLDFSAADPMMDLAKELGFSAVVSYGSGVTGFNAYFQDTNQAQAAGFKEYSQFLKAVFQEIQKHAEQRRWIPAYYNLGDEPLGDDLVRSAENAEAYRAAFPVGPPYFTAASSFTGTDAQDPHFRLSKALHVVDWNNHDEAGVNLLHKFGGKWAFYNGGNRWTYGTYMYKAVREFGMQFRLSWHWNVVAGDPYYALDCREDDYAWCNTSPDGQLIPSVHFEQLREGLDDYRRLLTLSRLIDQNREHAAARASRELITKRLASFRLGDRDHDALFGTDDWQTFRAQLDDAIETLSKAKRP
jgi:hypothetical protein